MSIDPDAQAATIRDAFATTVTGLRNDRTLTPPALKLALARAWLAAYAKMATLRSAGNAALNSSLDDLEQAVFGPPVALAGAEDTMSWRDAQDRADQVTSEQDAMAMLIRAGRSDDTLLARAVCVRAIAMGWRNVARSYFDEHPDFAAKYGDLVDGRAALSNPRARLQSNMIFSLSKPSEIASMDNYQMQAFVNAGAANGS